MTTVDDFVRTNILTFPIIFPNRSAVMHHALCVIGNGYEWHEGEVVSDWRRDPARGIWNEKQERLEMESELLTYNEIVRDILTPALRQNFEVTVETIRQVETRIHERVEIEHFYPQCEGALLLNIPHNVTPEWKEACEEMKKAAMKAGWAF